jgi:hypothetical protein
MRFTSEPMRRCLRLAALLVGTAGCERIVSVKAPAFEPRLVVEARLERPFNRRGPLQRIRLTTTQDVFTEADPPPAATSQGGGRNSQGQHTSLRQLLTCAVQWSIQNGNVSAGMLTDLHAHCLAHTGLPEEALDGDLLPEASRALSLALKLYHSSEHIGELECSLRTSLAVLDWSNVLPVYAEPPAWGRSVIGDGALVLAVDVLMRTLVRVVRKFAGIPRRVGPQRFDTVPGPLSTHYRGVPSTSAPV